MVKILANSAVLFLFIFTINAMIAVGLTITAEEGVLKVSKDSDQYPRIHLYFVSINYDGYMDKS